MGITIEADYGTKTLRVAFTLEQGSRNQQSGRVMRAGPFASLMDDGACQIEALMAVGRQLRKRYDAEMGDTLPQELQMQLQRLTKVEGARRSRSDG